MKKIHKGLVYDTDNPKYVIVAEYKSGEDLHIIYRVVHTSSRTSTNYVNYSKVTRVTDSPQPAEENMYIYTSDEIERILNNFRGEVYWEKFKNA